MTQPTANDLTFCRLVDRYLERVYRFLRNLTRNEDAARELAHETFLRLRRQIDAGQAPSEAYVFTTARNTALTRWRQDRNEHVKRQTAATETDQAAGLWCADPHDATAAGAVERRELRDGLEIALARLPEEQRSVFLLSMVEGLTYDEIGRIMGIPPGTVASRKHTATATLRRELERMGHALP